MYVPPAFRMRDDDALSLIDELPFATLIALPSGDVAHVPVLRADDVLHAHVARVSPFARLVQSGTEVLAIFRGAHGYISPRWYRSVPHVPTWNYEAVHVTGRARVLDDPEVVRATLAALSSRFEGEGGWSIDGVEPSFVRGLQSAIVAFEIPMERVEGKAKLGQNREVEDHAGAIEGLRAAGEHALADAMSRALALRRATQSSG